jgi:hypothetical protein
MHRSPVPTHPCCPHCATSVATPPEVVASPWDNPNPLWEIPKWSSYVGITPEFTRQLIKERRVASVKIGGKVLLEKSVADEVISAGRRPAQQPLNVNRFGYSR